MSMDARDRMINAFTNEPGVTVFLMSLKAGGVALNLTAASHVMLMDPWCAALKLARLISSTIAFPRSDVDVPAFAFHDLQLVMLRARQRLPKQAGGQPGDCCFQLLGAVLQQAQGGC